MSQCSVVAEKGNVLAFYSPYHPAMVSDLKIRIPSTDRRWDASRKCWLVTPDHGVTLSNLAEVYFNDQIKIPKLETKQTQQTIVVEIRYLGQCKERADGSNTAFGLLVDGTWSVIFPEEVLRDWFEAGPISPSQKSTLYSTLGIKRGATDEEIKAGYRRMARQWHPDVCKEIDATEQFMKIQKAYEILADPVKRNKYEAGLALAVSLREEMNQQESNIRTGYRAPLRCGFLMVEGVHSLNRFIVSKIFGWEDIRNSAGQILVVSWPSGADRPVEYWA